VTVTNDQREIRAIWRSLWHRYALGRHWDSSSQFARGRISLIVCQSLGDLLCGIQAFECSVLVTKWWQGRAAFSTARDCAPWIARTGANRPGPTTGKRIPHTSRPSGPGSDKPAGIISSVCPSLYNISIPCRRQMSFQLRAIRIPNMLITLVASPSKA